MQAMLQMRNEGISHRPRVKEKPVRGILGSEKNNRAGHDSPPDELNAQRPKRRRDRQEEHAQQRVAAVAQERPDHCVNLSSLLRSR
jgi:hypothetical protein